MDTKERGLDYRLLEKAAAEDTALSALALPLALAYRAAGDAGWAAGLPQFDRPLDERQPILAGQVLAVDASRARGLLLELARSAGKAGARGLEAVEAAVASIRLPALALMEAAIDEDAPRIEAMAAAAALPAAPLRPIAHLLAVPILHAAAWSAGPLLAGDRPQTGYCPVCGGWPQLAEVRGVERQRWLHCGSCGTAWRYPNQQCVFCGGVDHRRQGYLSVDGQQESTRAMTCFDCGGYLKAVAANVALSPVDSAAADLRTLDLDLAALERGYRRPDGPGARLNIRVVPL